MAYALTKCFKCKKVIHGQSRELGKQPFHVECLTCANCKAVLGADDNGKIRDNRIFCKGCFTKRFRPRCDSCRQPIAEGDGLKTGNKMLHSKCFRCAGCQRPMGPGKQVLIKNEIYCQVKCQQERVAREKAAAEALANAAKKAKEAPPAAPAAPPPAAAPAADAAAAPAADAAAAPAAEGEAKPVETAAEAPAAEAPAAPAEGEAAPAPAEGGGEAPPAEGGGEAPPAE